jgi:capsid protein
MVTVPAEQVIHDYLQERPGQTRGVPWLTPTLDPGAVYRDWIESTLTANQCAAKPSIIMRTNHPDATFDDVADTLPIFDLETGVGMAIPSGWAPEQITPQHPGAQFEAFSQEIHRMFGRPVGMPLIRVRCSAAGSNYSSARLDVQMYWREVESEESHLEHVKCDPLFALWYREMRLSDLLPEEPPEGWYHLWHWDPMPTIDAYKEAKAAEIRLRNRISTLADETEDWEATLETQARITAKAAELGLALTPEGGAAAEEVSAEDLASNLSASGE